MCRLAIKLGLSALVIPSVIVDCGGVAVDDVNAIATRRIMWRADEITVGCIHQKRKKVLHLVG